MENQGLHEICFRDVQNDWDSALPVGNGRIGAMVFYKDRVLHVAVNHYDCYYQGLSGRQSFQDPARYTETYEELCRRAKAVRDTEDSGRSHYARTLHPSGETGRPCYRGASYPQGGELLLKLDDKVDLRSSCLRLLIEEARIVFEAGRGDNRVTADIWAARELDGLVLDLTQSRKGLWKSAAMEISPAAGAEPCRVVYETEAGKLCMRAVYGTSFSQELALCLDGCLGPAGSKADGTREAGGAAGAGEAEGVEAGGASGTRRTERVEAGEVAGAGVSEGSKADNTWEAGGAKGTVRLNLSDLGDRMTAALSLRPGTGKALELAGELVKREESVRRRHQEFWERFWTGRVRLPDKFLERLWYLQLYLMECSCGRGSAYPEQACGLSGLWDIRRPNMWGSMWYWDVNIQSAFWGWGPAGHPEYWKLFCDGYLSYEEEIRAYTRQVYGMEGWALDYPHPLYHCIQPWCAQFLWEYYQYSGDREFLEQKAYPVFQEQLDFFVRLAVRDEQGIFHIEYDISPEQGPVTRDSVITISCIRRLAGMALEAGLLLNRPERELAAVKQILEQLPEYPVTLDGGRYKDSPLAPENLFLRHPSMLMPLFPAGDGAAGVKKEELERWERTLSYAAEHTETGTFGMGWLAAAAVGMGRGTTALRLIYEKGLDYILHSNGLAYEESDGFLNYCHLTKPAHYLPVMMEAAGGLVNAVNMMLLQEGEDKVIRVFPAVPGQTEDILGSAVQYREDDQAVEGMDIRETFCKIRPEGGRSPRSMGIHWDDVEFTGLLAAGGFRVSAVRNGGRAVFVKVESLRDGLLRLALPAELSETGRARVIERQMSAGEEICWGKAVKPDERNHEPEVLCHTAARTHRRIFLGADRHTAYHQAVDDTVCGYLFGNEWKYSRTPYIFDFGTGEGEKNYDDSYPPQIVLSGGCVLYAAGPRRTGPEEYTHERGYGFREKKDIVAVDRGEPDALRRDFLEGIREAVFMIRLPRGKYDLLLVCGDEKEESYTIIDLPNQGTMAGTGKLEAGVFGCKRLPLVLEQDDMLLIRARAGQGYKWKWNALFVSR